jgi:murein L,D-transpeptidase YcbB/YkuD
VAEHDLARSYCFGRDTGIGLEAHAEIRRSTASPSYMAENQLETYQEDGKTRLRQKPGDKNSLGYVKFLFPNDFNIYLHDTPQRELFNKDVRAFSHGCIRVEKPDELAQWVLGWDASKVEQAMLYLFYYKALTVM